MLLLQNFFKHLQLSSIMLIMWTLKNKHSTVLTNKLLYNLLPHWVLMPPSSVLCVCVWGGLSLARFSRSVVVILRKLPTTSESLIHREFGCWGGEIIFSPKGIEIWHQGNDLAAHFPSHHMSCGCMAAKRWQRKDQLLTVRGVCDVCNLGLRSQAACHNVCVSVVVLFFIDTCVPCSW